MKFFSAFKNIKKYFVQLLDTPLWQQNQTLHAFVRINSPINYDCSYLSFRDDERWWMLLELRPHSGLELALPFFFLLLLTCALSLRLLPSLALLLKPWQQTK